MKRYRVRVKAVDIAAFIAYLSGTLNNGVNTMMYNTIGPICQGHEATIENARDCIRGLDWREYEVVTQNIGHARYVETLDGINIFYDYGADYYFFTIEYGV